MALHIFFGITIISLIDYTNKEPDVEEFIRSALKNVPPTCNENQTETTMPKKFKSPNSSKVTPLKKRKQEMEKRESVRDILYCTVMISCSIKILNTVE